MDIRELIEEQIDALEVESPDDNSDDIPDETDGATEELEQSDAQEDEGESDEDSEAEADDDDGEAVAEDELVVEVIENAKLKMPDGTLVDADKAVLMQADYTRKTQELAEQRKAFEAEKSEIEAAANEVYQAYEQAREWYESRAAKPSSWVAEIVSEAKDPTSVLAKAIYDLAQNGVLDPQFVQAFGIESGTVAEQAKKSEINDELEEIKQWKSQQEQEAQRRAAVQQQAQRYENEWEQIKQSRQLRFKDRVEELDVKRHLLQFAMDNNLGRSLIDAYDLMTVRNPIAVQKQGSPDPVVAAKKRANRAVTPKSAVSGSVKKSRKDLSTREAILEAMEEVATRTA